MASVSFYVQSRLIAGRSRFVLAWDQVFWPGREAKNRQANRAERGTSPLLLPLPALGWEWLTLKGEEVISA